MATFSRFRPLAAFTLLLPSFAAATLVDWGLLARSGPTIDAILTHTDAASLDLGLEHTVLLKSDGTIRAWGTDYAGSTQVPANLTSMVKVAAGHHHSIAMRSTGTVRVWGRNQHGQRSVPSGLSGVVDVSAGGDHNLVAKADGTVLAWGRNDAGQATVPAGLNGVSKVAAGWHHSLALRANGTVVAWGANGLGQTSVPAGLNGVVAIDAGYDYSVAVKANGTVVAWGKNDEGQCDVPLGLSGVVKVAAGPYHCLALRTNGTVVGWGRNLYGQTDSPATLRGVSAIAAGNSTSWAVGRAFTVMTNPQVLQAGDSALGHIDLGDPAPSGGATVNLALTGELGNRVEVPATVNVPAGQTRATFPVASFFGFGTPKGRIEASRGGETAVSNFLDYFGATAKATTVKASTYGGSIHSLPITVKLSRITPIDVPLRFSTSDHGLIAPDPVTIPAGSDSVTFNLFHRPVTQDAIMHLLVWSGDTGLCSIGVRIRTMIPVVTIPDLTIEVGQSVRSTVVMPAPVREATTVTLESNTPAAKVNATTTIPAGKNEGVFYVRGAQVGEASIFATVNSIYRWRGVTVIPAVIRGVTEVAVPAALPGLKDFTGTVKLGAPAPAGGTVVTLTASYPAVTLPATVTVPSGQSSVTFSAKTTDVDRFRHVQILAEGGNASASGSVRVDPVGIGALTVSTAMVKGGQSLTGTVTLGSTVNADTLVSIESADPSALTVPTTVTVPAGAKSKTFAIGTSAVGSSRYVRVTVRKNGTSAYRTVKVTP